ncbi:MAG: four helix bundle protein [Pyrinomonadaceae bacterium]
MRPHENLEVWQKAVDFVVMIYEKTKHFPTDERFGLTSQIRRASVSIPANIAEGAARQSDKELMHFLAIAQGSCSEVETELLISNRLGFLSEAEYTELKSQADSIGRMLVGLSKHLKNKTA